MLIRTQKLNFCSSHEQELLSKKWWWRRWKINYLCNGLRGSKIGKSIKIYSKAEEKQMKSVGFPVFESKDHTTSATIMLMAIKLTITE